MELIQSYIAQHPEIPYVIDPVMLAKSGDSLMDDEGKNNLKSILLPLATVATPNIPEASGILGVATVASGNKIDFKLFLPSSSISESPLFASITGSITYGISGC